MNDTPNGQSGKDNQITPPRPEWSEPEKWVWEQSCLGLVADFNERYRNPLDATKEEVWSEEEKARRGLSSDFLRTILTREPWKEAITENGVCIYGAYFDEQVDLSQAGPICTLWLDNSRLTGGLVAYYLKVAGVLSLERSWLGGELSLHRAEVKSDLYLRRAQIIKAVNLASAHVGGQLSMIGSTFEGKLNMDKLQVTSSLFMRDQAVFKDEVILKGTRVGDQVEMAGSTFEKRLTMSGLQVAASLLMGGKAVFMGEVILFSTRVGGKLVLDGSTFEGRLAVDSLEVAANLLMGDKAVFQDEVILQETKINDQLSMNGASFAGGLSMHRVTVGTDFFLDKVGITQQPAIISFCRVDGVLVLRDAQFKALDLTGSQVGAIICDRLDWPQDIKLDSFTYGHLGGMGEGYAGERMTDWPASWFIKWLAKQKEYSPQPYEQCAKVLREAGQPGKANAVLYAGKERERKQAWEQLRQEWKEYKYWDSSFIRWLWLWLHGRIIGYGLGWRCFYALWPVAVITIIGAVVAGTTPLALDHGWGWLCGFSFSRLIPLVNFGKIFEVVVHGWQEGYFMGHQLAGWALASFIIAGMAGMTRKP